MIEDALSHVTQALLCAQSTGAPTGFVSAYVLALMSRTGSSLQHVQTHQHLQAVSHDQAESLASQSGIKAWLLRGSETLLSLVGLCAPAEVKLDVDFSASKRVFPMWLPVH